MNFKNILLCLLTISAPLAAEGSWEKAFKEAWPAASAIAIVSLVGFSFFNLYRIHQNDVEIARLKNLQKNNVTHDEANKKFITRDAANKKFFTQDDANKKYEEIKKFGDSLKSQIANSVTTKVVDKNAIDMNEYFSKILAPQYVSMEYFTDLFGKQNEAIRKQASTIKKVKNQIKKSRKGTIRFSGSFKQKGQQ